MSDFGIAMTAFVYMLRCRDGRYYVGSTRGSLDKRVSEHNSGAFGGFTKPRGPVELVYSQRFDRIMDAIAAERQLKGWSRAKKEALINGRFDDLKRLARNRTQYPLSPADRSFDKLRMRHEEVENR